MAERKRITGNKKKVATKEDRARRLDAKTSEWKHPEYTCNFCWTGFLIDRAERGGTKATMDFYSRFFKKFTGFLDFHWKCEPKDMPIELLTTDMIQALFMSYLTQQGLGVQTVNSYLRAYRAWGNWAEEEGYLDGFKCPIKEVEPPAKQVYTDKELEKLMVKPSVNDFSAYRMYIIVSLILNTGARSNTILNIRICDVELDEGYITFNTTKAHKVVRLGLERKVRRDLGEWIQYWRLDKGAEPTDYLFCNEYGEQMARSTLTKAMRVYCEKRGVEKTSIHLLRHTFAKKWITSGGDIVTLARVLTHSELEMVKRYANLYSGDVKAEIEQHSAISQMKTRSGATLKNQKRKLADND